MHRRKASLGIDFFSDCVPWLVKHHFLLFTLFQLSGGVVLLQFKTGQNCQIGVNTIMNGRD